MSAAKFQWYVLEGWCAPRRWFVDELTARTYFLLVCEAFDLKPGIDVFLGRDVQPPHVAAAYAAARGTR